MHSNLKTVGLASLLLLLASACTTHYTLTGIDRTRIIVDSRYDAQPEEAAVKFLEPYRQGVDSVMGPLVGTVARDMPAHRPESLLSNLLPDILVWAAKDYGEKPDFGVYNVGGIRATLVKGSVTYGDVLDVAPFENKICFLTLSGQKVMELFAQIAMRGGEGVSHGVELVISPKGKLLEARLHGQPIDPQASYRVTTIDYLAQGNDQLTAFKDCTELNSPQEESNNTRFIIMDYFRQKQTQGQAVDAQLEGRIIVREE